MALTSPQAQQVKKHWISGTVKLTKWHSTWEITAILSPGLRPHPRRRGWGEAGRAANRLFVLSYKTAFRRRGATRGRRALWWRCRCCPAERCVRSLCSPALWRPPPPPKRLLAPMLPGELNIHWRLITMSGRWLPHNCTFLIEYTTNTAATAWARRHTGNLKRSLGIKLFCQFASPKKSEWHNEQEVGLLSPVPQKSFSRPANATATATATAAAIPTHSPPRLIPRATALLDFDIISWNSREALLSL